MSGLGTGQAVSQVNGEQILHLPALASLVGEELSKETVVPPHWCSTLENPLPPSTDLHFS